QPSGRREAQTRRCDQVRRARQDVAGAAEPCEKRHDRRRVEPRHLRSGAKRPSLSCCAMSAAVRAVQRTAVRWQMRMKRQVNMHMNGAHQKCQDAEREPHQKTEEIETCESHRTPRAHTYRSALCARCTWRGPEIE